MNYGDDDQLESFDLALEKARRERILCERDKIELELVKQNLVVRDDVHRAAFESSRKLRDRLHSVTKQSAPVVSGMTSTSEIEAYLREEIDSALEEFIETCV